MAICPLFQEFAKDVLRRDAGEIGMHLHAWNSPPEIPLTADDYRFQPYLIEYSDPILHEKTRIMTDLLASTFQVPITSHRAGRWGFDSRYAACLDELGYRADCSVVPGVSFRSHLGDPAGQGGPDFTHSSSEPHYLSPTLLEVPMTVLDFTPRPLRSFVRPDPASLPARVLNRLFPRQAWLRPTGRNLSSLLNIVEHARAANPPYLMFMLHSSEFMPGGSPTFRDQRSIETLYSHLEQLFEAAAQICTGSTLTAFADSWGSASSSHR
jgi:hypothetical protein